MPSPSRHYAHRASPSSSSRYHRGAGALSSPEAVDRNPTDDGGALLARQRILKNNASEGNATVGKRTGVTLPPRGEIPLDEDGLEDADAFFAAAKSPASPGSIGSGSPGKAYGKRAEKAMRDRRRREEERRRRQELEEEGRRNVARGPDILNSNDDDDDNDENDVCIGDEDREGKPHAKTRRSYQPTPKQPGWTNRSLHRAMGVPTENSPQYTVLSKVSTAAPSTRGSVDTIATESRHGLREKHSEALLEGLARHDEEGSPPAMAEGGVQWGVDASLDAGRGAGEEEEADFGGPMDPPEEMSQESSHGGEKRGMDPVERDHLLEPEEKDEMSEDEEVGEDGASARKYAQSAASDYENMSAKRSAKIAASKVDNTSEKQSGKSDASEFENVSAKESARSVASNAASSLGDVSAKPSAKSAASGATNPLEGTLEEVVNSNYNQDYNDDDDGDIGGGGMQFVTQQPEDGERFENDDDVNFGSSDNVGFGDSEDDLNEEEGLQGDNDDAVNHQASHVSEKSRKSNNGYKSDKSESSQKSRASSFKSNTTHASSLKSGRREMGQISEHQSSSEEEEEEEEPPKKKKAKDARKQPPPTTPTSVLRTKKSKKKKQQSNNRVNWSTPNGNSTGIPAGNRGYEAIPVSDFKEDYPPGEEPKTPGGSTLRRSRRAKFQPLQFWKNEKLIYEAQNEKGLLGEAMGDMPVVAGVQKAQLTPYKEVKKRKEPPKKKNRRNSDDEDDGEGRSRLPFDDRALRKKYRINNGESGSVWSETLESATDVKIVSRLDNRTFSKLPLSSARRKRESKVVGFASQAFHVPTDRDDLFPGYISGNVVLPPRGIKDAEGVGLCSQVFNVGDCQDGSVEFAVADPSGQDGEFDPKSAQRYLLGKGDMFQIPPGNVYRIENHSKTEKVNLFWTIVKCTSRAEQEDSGDDEED
mmetsp:Transcript_32212/g.68590  ORF Transcript_32212/g.68590 Transcript_32212/m.68590 type:complete len:928 (-) Transcript_32212:210-2993(-)